MVQNQLSDLLEKRQNNVRVLRKTLNVFKGMSMNEFESASHGIINIFEYLDKASMNYVEFIHKSSTRWCNCNNKEYRTHTGIKSSTLVLNAIPDKENSFWTMLNDFQQFAHSCEICHADITQIREIVLGKEQKYLFITLNSRPRGFGTLLRIDKSSIENSDMMLFSRKAKLIGAIQFVNGNHFTTWCRYVDGWLIINDDKKEFSRCLPNDLSSFESLLFEFDLDDKVETELRSPSPAPALDVSFGNMSVHENETPEEIFCRVTFIQGQDVDDCMEGIFLWKDNRGTLFSNTDHIICQDSCSHELLKELLDGGVQFGGYDIRAVPGASPINAKSEMNDNATKIDSSPRIFEQPDIDDFQNSFDGERSIITSDGVGDNVKSDNLSIFYKKFKLNFDTSGEKINGQWSKKQFEHCFGEFPYVIRRRKGKKDYKQFFCPLCNRKDTKKALFEHLKKDHCFGKSRFDKDDICNLCGCPVTSMTWKKHLQNCFKKNFVQANIDRARKLDEETLRDIMKEDDEENDNSEAD